MNVRLGEVDKEMARQLLNANRSNTNLKWKEKQYKTTISDIKKGNLSRRIIRGSHWPDREMHLGQITKGGLGTLILLIYQPSHQKTSVP